MEINNIKINEDERIDDLHRNGYLIIQNPKYFCFGIDAVLLSGFVNVKKGESVIDLGTGTGIIPILLEAKTEAKHFVGIEIQEQSVDMAKRSVLLNGIEDKIEIIKDDIKNVMNIFAYASFDVVTSNPPYMNAGGGLINDYGPKAIARHEILCNLEDIIGISSKLLRYGGRFYMVHRPHRLSDIIVLMRKYNIEAKSIRFVHSHIDKKPSMVLIEGVKNGKPMTNIEPPLIIYNQDGTYTKEIYDIYYN